MKKGKTALLVVLCLVVVAAAVGCTLFFVGRAKGGDSPNANGERGKTSSFPEVAPNGYVVYFNPETGKVCTKQDYNANEGASDTGNKSGCMKWYVFNDDGGDTVNLLLDHNTTATVAWGSEESGQPDSVVNQLLLDVAGWADDIKVSTRLITANEVAQITGNMDFDSAKEGMEYFSFLPDDYVWETDTSPYGWLYDRTGDFCTNFGAFNDGTPDSGDVLNGYWTSTPYIDDHTYSWGVNQYGTMNNVPTETNDEYGVRPVINMSRQTS